VHSETGEGTTQARLVQGKNVVRTTHIGASAMLMRKGEKTHLRDRLMNLLNKSSAVQSRMIHNLSQLAHRYRKSGMISGKTGNLSAGDRLPNQSFFDAQSNTYLWLFDLLNSKKFSLLLVDSRNKITTNHSWQSMIEKLYKHYPIDQIHTHVITTQVEPFEYVPKGATVWVDRAMDLRLYHQPGTITAYFVRPDGHLAYVHSPAQWQRTPYLHPKTTTDVDCSVRTRSNNQQPSFSVPNPKIIPVIKSITMRSVDKKLLFLSIRVFPKRPTPF
jgi:hypothetical protein